MSLWSFEEALKNNYMMTLYFQKLLLVKKNNIN